VWPAAPAGGQPGEQAPAPSFLDPFGIQPPISDSSGSDSSDSSGSDSSYSSGSGSGSGSDSGSDSGSGGSGSGSWRNAGALSVEDIDFFEHAAMLYGRRGGVSSMCRVQLCSGRETDFSPALTQRLSAYSYHLQPSSNDHDPRHVRFDLSSPLLPSVSGDTDLSDLADPPRIAWSHEQAVPGTEPRFEAGAYLTETLSVAVSAGDAAPCRVPLTVISARGRDRRAPGPLLLLGYGSYGVSLPMNYRPEHIVLLEKGWTLAFAHVRGGGELGLAWYHDGYRMKKWNTFLDFAACAEDLIRRGYTTERLMCGEFESAGGLIGGVMINEYPHLFAGIILRNPFLDVLGAMQDQGQALTAHEYDEWGRPDREEDLDYIKSYSPFSNITEVHNSIEKEKEKEKGEGGRQPNKEIEQDTDNGPTVLVSLSLQDHNVAPWETLGWINKIRNVREQGLNSGRDSGADYFQVHKFGGVFFRIISDAGHSGPQTLTDQYAERALEIAFLDHAVSVSVSPSVSAAVDGER
jgi:protease II